MTLIDLNSILPVLLLVIWALVMLLLDVWFGKRVPLLTPILAAAGLAAALGADLLQLGHPASTFNGMIRVDGFSMFLNILFTLSGLVAIGLGYDYLKRAGIREGEYYILLLFSISGMMTTAASKEAPR